MNKVILARFLQGTAWVLLLVGGLLLASHQADEFLSVRQADYTISQAGYSGPSTASGKVDLPLLWQSRIGELETRSFHLDLLLETVPDDGLYLYLPFFEQRLQVSLQNIKLYDSRVQGRWNPLDRSTALVLLPRTNLRTGHNDILLVVETGPAPLGSLSQVIVGSFAQLQQVYHARSFLRHVVKPILVGMQAFLALTGLLLFALRPKDVVFGWLGLLMAIASVSAMGAVTTGIPLVDSSTRQVFIIMPVAGLSLLGFSLSLTRAKASLQVLATILGVVALTFAATVLFSVPRPTIGLVFSIPVFIVCTLISVAILTIVSLREPRLEVVLFLFSLILLAVGVAHDYAVRLDIFSGTLFLGPFSRFLSVGAIALFIVRQLVAQAKSLDEAADNLRTRLWEKEAELESYYRRQKRLDEARLLAEERSRITADLHDGVAGHLTTIVALSDQTEDVNGEIKQSARNALVDLRMVMDAMAVSGGSLRYYLGLFRDRCVDPLGNLGLTVNWSMTRLPDVENLPQERALNIIRVLQEAVNNALRHGNPTQLDIIGEPEGPDQIKLTVADSGGTPRQAKDSGGRGLTNMRRRAHAIGGSVDFTFTELGGSVVLIFPLRVAKGKTTQRAWPLQGQRR